MLYSSINVILIHAHWAIPTGLIGLWWVIPQTPLIVTIHGSDFRIGSTKPFMLKRFFYMFAKGKNILYAFGVLRREIEKLSIKSRENFRFSYGGG